MKRDSSGCETKADDVFCKLFDDRFGCGPAVIARAPGRVEVIGNHTDYNGGSVLGGAINYSLTFGVAAAVDGTMRMASTVGGDTLCINGREGEYELQSGDLSWANYILGCYNAFRREFAVELGPLKILVDSTLPAGAGLSSSAALELAALYGFAALADIEPQPAHFARLARRVENECIGVPCGILDQGTIAHGRRDSLVLIDCEAEHFSTLTAPSRPHFHLFNTGKKHRLADSLYPVRHRECQLALEALRIDNPRLVNLASASLDMLNVARQRMDEDHWLRAHHVISENQRVKDSVAAFQSGEYERLGGLMQQSHLSSRDRFKNSCDELDVLVELLGAEEDVYGARLTGGGFGGAVLALCTKPLDPDTVARVCARYAERFGEYPDSLPITLEAGVSAMKC